MKIAPDIIRSLKPNEVFVFGSNDAGRHGAGAALLAAKRFGAIYGQGRGMMGQSYGIATKDRHIKTLPLQKIDFQVVIFLCYAQSRPDLEFLVTQIGCGLAGYTPREIAPIFRNPPINVALPLSFWKEIESDWPHVDTFTRASQDCICEHCGHAYREHPMDGPEHDGHKWLHRLCDKSLVKL